MDLNGGDPRTYKKIQDDNDATNLENNLSSSSSNIGDSGNLSNQTTASTSVTDSSSNIINKTEPSNRSSDDHGKPS